MMAQPTQKKTRNEVVGWAIRIRVMTKTAAIQRVTFWIISFSMMMKVSQLRNCDERSESRKVWS